MKLTTGRNTLLLGAGLLLLAFLAFKANQQLNWNRLPPICNQMLQEMPQTLEEAELEYGIPTSNITLLERSECTTRFTKVYWGFEVWGNLDKVPITVPEGGIILNHIQKEDGIHVEKYYEGQVTGHKLYVLGSTDF